MVHNGEHGLLLLSRLPLSAPSIFVLPSTGQRRAAIGARASTGDGADVQLFCTALGHGEGARLPGEPYPGDSYTGIYGTASLGWSDEQWLQAQQLATHIDDRAEGHPVALLGNFGSSPELIEDGEVVLVEAGSAVFETLGAVLSPAQPDGLPQCTVCPSNTLATREHAVDAGPTWQNRVYTRGMTATHATRAYLGAVVDVKPIPYPSILPHARVPISAQYAYRVSVLVNTR